MLVRFPDGLGIKMFPHGLIQRVYYLRFLRINSTQYRNLVTGEMGVEAVPKTALPDDYSIANANDSDVPRHRKKVISRALEVYLNDVGRQNKIMAREKAEFELGKRYLANMMGLEPSNITQDDIDKAMEYLFPSGLTDKLALPVMKPPEEILPMLRQIAFDDEGRPKDLLFFTLAPKFYRLLSVRFVFILEKNAVGTKTEALLCYQQKQEIAAENDSKAQKVYDLHLIMMSSYIELLGTEWISQQMLSKKLEEKITDEMYAHLIVSLDYMVSLPGAHTERDFIFEYRKSVAVGAKDVIFGAKVPPVQLVEGTNQRMAKVEVRLKASFAEVEVRDKGSGVYTVDGYGLDVFRSLQAREIFLAPLIVTDLLGKVDITGKITDGPGGASVIPRIIRHGASLCIVALFPEHFDKLRLAGLLTSDPRKRERYKISQKGARAKWIWFVIFLFSELSYDVVFTVKEEINKHNYQLCLWIKVDG
uniref:Peptidylprolyl isomerase n=1 Tax=Elaeophora elaphi TaxID=1147741 RepID=A0A0R3RFS7_9BILA